MCGIAGYIGENEAAHQLVPRGLSVLTHRGPDSSGAYRDETVSLGMTRLAIIDLPGGEQPMRDASGTLCIVFNGEIFNYRELREELASKGRTFRTSSDTEVLLQMYAEYGPSMLERLRGMFAFAIHDREQRQVVFARDRFGKKPLYLRRHGQQLWFGSELKAVTALSTSSAPLTISAQSVYDYLSFGAVPQPTTIYSEVEALPAATYAVLDASGDLKVSRYWEPSFEPDNSLDLDDAVAEVRRLISNAVRIRLRSDVPVGVLLSGGIDSSIIAVEARRHFGPDLETYSVATGAPDLDEADIAARTAAALGIRNHRLDLRLDVAEAVKEVVRAYDQPFADSSAIPSLQIAELAGQRVRVVLNGDGGDELFAGYRRHLAASQLDRFGRFIPNSRALAALGNRWQPERRSRAGLALRLMRGVAAEPPERYLIYTHDMLRERDRGIWRGPYVQPSERLLAQSDVGSILRTQITDDIQLNLTSDLLVKMDIACMAHSVEGRSPLLDADVAAFALKLPDGFKVRDGVGKWILRRAYEKELSHEVLTAPKRGFEVPLDSWLNNQLRDLVGDSVLAPDARINTFLDARSVREVFEGRLFAERNRAAIKYALLVLEMWLRSSEREVLGAP